MIGLFTAPAKIIAVMVVIVIMMIMITEFAIVPNTTSDASARIGMTMLTVVFLVMTPFVIARMTAREVADDGKSVAKGTLKAATSVRNLVTGN